MVRRGSAMTKKAGGGEEGLTMTGIKKSYSVATCTSGDDGRPPLLELGHLGAALGLVRDEHDSEEHHGAGDGKGYVVACNASASVVQFERAGEKDSRKDLRGRH